MVTICHHEHPRSIATPIWGGIAAISQLQDSLPQYRMNQWSLDILMKMLVPGQETNIFHFAGETFKNIILGKSDPSDPAQLTLRCLLWNGCQNASSSWWGNVPWQHGKWFSHSLQSAWGKQPIATSKADPAGYSQVTRFASNNLSILCFLFLAFGAIPMGLLVKVA